MIPSPWPTTNASGLYGRMGRGFALVTEGDRAQPWTRAVVFQIP